VAAETLAAVVNKRLPIVAIDVPSGLGLYGFGVAPQIVAKVATWPRRSVHGFTRPRDQANQAFTDLRAGRFEGAAVLVR